MILAGVALLRRGTWPRPAVARYTRPAPEPARVIESPDGAAPPIPGLIDGAPPLAILVDYDGTIAMTDVSDTVMAEHVPGGWEAEAAAYDAGLIGSRRLMTLEMSMVDADPAASAGDSRRPAARRGLRTVRPACSGGRDPGRGRVGRVRVLHSSPALERLGVAELPVVTARTTFTGRRRGDRLPERQPDCLVCGTCKRNRVLAHQAAGRAVVFIGDGESDRYAAGYSDVVFAKRALIRICLEAGWPFRRWTEFAEIDAWLAETVWRRGKPIRRRLVVPSRRPFFCGPEVWGDGRIDPPPGAWPPG